MLSTEPQHSRYIQHLVTQLLGGLANGHPTGCLSVNCCIAAKHGCLRPISVSKPRGEKPTALAESPLEKPRNCSPTSFIAIFHLIFLTILSNLYRIHINPLLSRRISCARQLRLEQAVGEHYCATGRKAACPTFGCICQARLQCGALAKFLLKEAGSLGPPPALSTSSTPSRLTHFHCSNSTFAVPCTAATILREGLC